MEFLSEFLTSPLNLPYFTLISTIKYKQNDTIKELQEYYSEGTVADLAEISAEYGQNFEIFLRRIVLETSDKIFLIPSFEGDTLAETMQGAIFLKKYCHDQLSDKGCDLDPIFLKNKAFMMLLIGHEITHKTRFEVAPNKNILFSTPRKEIFATQDECKPYEVGVGWELFISKQRIFENDFDDTNIVDLFVNRTNWEQQIFQQFFEIHRKKYKIDQGSMFGKKYNNAKNYRCSLCYVFFNYVIIIKNLKSLLCLMLRSKEKRN